MSLPHDFDFDLMMRLAGEAPGEFARQREMLIQEAIDSFRVPAHGRQLQAVIDTQRVCVSKSNKLNTDNARGVQLAEVVSSLSQMIRRIRIGDENDVHSLAAVSQQQPRC
jgi:hypothetical protein